MKSAVGGWGVRPQAAVKDLGCVWLVNHLNKHTQHCGQFFDGGFDFPPFPKGLLEGFRLQKRRCIQYFLVNSRRNKLTALPLRH